MSTNTRVISSLVVGAIAMMGSGPLFDYHIISGGLSKAFNNTAGQIDVVYLAGLGGFASGAAAGLVLSKISAMWVCVGSCVFSTVAYLLLWSTDFVSNPSLILTAMCNLLAGHSMSYLYYTTILINFRNNSRENMGKVSGLLHSCFLLSPPLVTLVLAQTSIRSNAPSIVFLVLLALSCGSSFISILGLRQVNRKLHGETTNTFLPRPPTADDVRDFTSRAYEYPPSDTDEGSEPEDTVSTVSGYPMIAGGVATRTSLGRGALLTQIEQDVVERQSDGRRAFHGPFVDFYFYKCVLSFAFAVGTVINLLRNVLRVDDPHYFIADHYAVVIGLFAASWSGPVTDRFHSSLSRGNVLLFGLIGVLFALLGSLVLVDAVWLLCATAALCGGLFWTLTPCLLRERYRLRHLPVYWSLALLAAVVVAGALEVAAYFLQRHYGGNDDGMPPGDVCPAEQSRCSQLLRAAYLATTICSAVWTYGLVDVPMVNSGADDSVSSIYGATTA